MLTTIPWDGTPISIAGCYGGIPLDAYHKPNICVGPSASSTTLRTIYGESLAHYWDDSPYNPNRAPQDFTKADAEWKTLGRAAHHLLIGGVGHFQREYTIQPAVVPLKDPGNHLGWSEEHAGKKWHGSITYCKRWGISKRKAGFTILTDDQIKTIEGMAISLGADPYVAGGVLDGLIERSLFWKDQETGIWLKSRPDAIPTSSGDASDLKTTQSVLWHRLMYAIDDLGYNQQGALIGDGLKAVFNMNMASFLLVWIEKKRPYCVRTTPIDTDDIQRGRLQNRVAIRKFANCMEKLAAMSSDSDIVALKSIWPGPASDRSGDEVGTLSLSPLARERIDKRLRFEQMIT
jgi:hypothetical protein